MANLNKNDKTLSSLFWSFWSPLTHPWDLPVCQGGRRKPHSGNPITPRSQKNRSTMQSTGEKQPCYLHTRNQIDPLDEVSKAFLADRQILPTLQ